MDNVLGKYNEVDENGNEILDAQGNPTKCSRSTSISNMPEDAVKALDTYLSCIDDNAKNKGFINGIGGAYNALHNVLVVPPTADRTSMLDVYYDYVDTKYNWDVETKAAKRAFLASFMVMYNNAYALYSAKLGVELYKAKGNDAATQGICVSLNDLERYANEVSEVLYGDIDWDGLRSDYPGKSNQSSDGMINATDIDTEKLLKDNPGMTFDEVVQAKYLRVSSYMSEATDTDTGKIKFLATDSTRSRSYDTGSYALTAAYDESCFARAYVTVKDQYVEDTWHPSCSFSMDELRTMVRRLNALPSSMRMTITDSDGNTRPVENIAEEMEAVGFNSQQPNTQFTKVLLNIDTNTMKQREERLIGSRDALWAQNGRTTEVWATVLAGDMNATDEVDRFSDVAWNWNYFFTDFEYNIVYKKKSWNLPRDLTVRQQYAQNLSSGTDRLISSAPIGNQITDPQNYITLSAAGLKCYVSEWDSGKGKYGDIFSSQVSLRYGSIFNLKTGDIVENQLLYAFESMDPPLGGVYSLVTGMPSAVRCEYYPFGELNVSTNGKAALMADPGMWYQPNWYSKAITSSNYAGSQNNSIDIRRHHLETD